MMTTVTDQLALDDVLAAAQSIARAELELAVESDTIGEYLGVEMEAEYLATHLFVCTNPGYRNWRWAVTVTRLPDSSEVTVCESVLLPGDGAVLAPEWVPWQQRIEPGDLGVGDLLPTESDDPRLVPGYTGNDLDPTEDDDLRPVGWELGLGRVRVLSVAGRDEAAQRWIAGETGPRSPIARAVTDQCATCGFLVPMNGPLGAAFGLCANEFSPADGRVVALTHGCGAHSEVEPPSAAVPVVDLVVDDHAPEALDTEELTNDELADDSQPEDIDDDLEPDSDPIIDVIEEALVDVEIDAADTLTTEDDK